MKIKSIRASEPNRSEHDECCTPGGRKPAGAQCCPPVAHKVVSTASACCTEPSAATAASPSCCTSPPGVQTDKPPCCGPAATCTGGVIDETVPGFLGWLDTAAGRVPQISTRLTAADHMGACMVRWGIRRMSYIVPPGLYAIGAPDAAAPVVVTCNYRMTYDSVRRELSTKNVWLLVLETHGVNVWCAAGKGTFGTGELVERITISGLARVVSHRRLLLPILGAPGVAAHEVARRSGFGITYVAIRAGDLPEFLDNGQQTTVQMRQLTFSLYERLVLVPVELLHSLRATLIISLILFTAAMFSNGSTAGLMVSVAYGGAVLTGVALGPVLLPWLPGKSFAGKGAAAGLLWSFAWYILAGGNGWSPAEIIASFLGLPAVSAYYTLNFTGCSPYTSRTGVKKEMRLSLPLMGTAVAASLLALLLDRLLS